MPTSALSALELVDFIRVPNAVTITNEMVASLDWINVIKAVENFLDGSFKNKLRAWSSV